MASSGDSSGFGPAFQETDPDSWTKASAIGTWVAVLSVGLAVWGIIIERIRRVREADEGSIGADGCKMGCFRVEPVGAWSALRGSKTEIVKVAPIDALIHAGDMCLWTSADIHRLPPRDTNVHWVPLYENIFSGMARFYKAVGGDVETAGRGIQEASEGVRRAGKHIRAASLWGLVGASDCWVQERLQAAGGNIRTANIALWEAANALGTAGMDIPLRCDGAMAGCTYQAGIYAVWASEAVRVAQASMLPAEAGSLDLGREMPSANGTSTEAVLIKLQRLRAQCRNVRAQCQKVREMGGGTDVQTRSEQVLCQAIRGALDDVQTICQMGLAQGVDAGVCRNIWAAAAAIRDFLHSQTRGQCDRLAKSTQAAGASTLAIHRAMDGIVAASLVREDTIQVDQPLGSGMLLGPAALKLIIQEAGDTIQSVGGTFRQGVEIREAEDAVRVAKRAIETAADIIPATRRDPRSTEGYIQIVRDSVETARAYIRDATVSIQLATNEIQEALGCVQQAETAILTAGNGTRMAEDAIHTAKHALLKAGKDIRTTKDAVDVAADAILAITRDADEAADAIPSAKNIQAAFRKASGASQNAADAISKAGLHFRLAGLGAESGIRAATRVIQMMIDASPAIRGAQPTRDALRIAGDAMRKAKDAIEPILGTISAFEKVYTAGRAIHDLGRSENLRAYDYIQYARKELRTAYQARGASSTRVLWATWGAAKAVRLAAGAVGEVLNAVPVGAAMVGGGVGRSDSLAYSARYFATANKLFAAASTFRHAADTMKDAGGAYWGIERQGSAAIPISLVSAPKPPKYCGVLASSVALSSCIRPLYSLTLTGVGRPEKTVELSTLKATLLLEGRPHIEVSREDLAAISLVLGVTLKINEYRSSLQGTGCFGSSVYSAPDSTGIWRLRIDPGISEGYARGTGFTSLMAKHVACGSLPFREDNSCVWSVFVSSAVLDAITEGRSIMDTHENTVEPPLQYLHRLPQAKQIDVYSGAGPRSDPIGIILARTGRPVDAEECLWHRAVAAIAFGGLVPQSAENLIKAVAFTVVTPKDKEALRSCADRLLDIMIRVHQRNRRIKLFGEDMVRLASLHERGEHIPYSTPERFDNVQQAAATFLDYTTLLEHLMALCGGPGDVRTRVYDASCALIGHMYDSAVSGRGASDPAEELEPILGAFNNSESQRDIRLDPNQCAKVVRGILVAWASKVPITQMKVKREDGLAGFPRGGAAALESLPPTLMLGWQEIDTGHPTAAANTGTNLKTSTDLTAHYDNKLPMIQAFNIFLNRYAKSTGSIVIIGSSKTFSLSQSSATWDLGAGLTAIRGFFASVRAATCRILVNVNVNVSHSPFYYEGPLDRLTLRFDAQQQDQA
ncbi:hypothetical protein DL770_010777 [Monosporascus sp. CRB-9-2]|nr:hypothetical protein DL770_010777 [Monosporascus sp. CRB-9-2]